MNPQMNSQMMRLMNPQMGQPMNPQMGQPINPQIGHQINPQTGRQMNSPMNSQINSPMNSQMGTVFPQMNMMYPQIQAPINPSIAPKIPTSSASSSAFGIHADNQNTQLSQQSNKSDDIIMNNTINNYDKQCLFDQNKYELTGVINSEKIDSFLKSIQSFGTTIALDQIPTYHEVFQTVDQGVQNIPNRLQNPNAQAQSQNSNAQNHSQTPNSQTQSQNSNAQIQSPNPNAQTQSQNKITEIKDQNDHVLIETELVNILEERQRLPNSPENQTRFNEIDERKKEIIKMMSQYKKTLYDQSVEAIEHLKAQEKKTQVQSSLQKEEELFDLLIKVPDIDEYGQIQDIFLPVNKKIKSIQLISYNIAKPQHNIHKFCNQFTLIVDNTPYNCVLTPGSYDLNTIFFIISGQYSFLEFTVDMTRGSPKEGLVKIAHRNGKNFSLISTSFSILHLIGFNSSSASYTNASSYYGETKPDLQIPSYIGFSIVNIIHNKSMVIQRPISI